jgi:LysM repeat protein
LKREAVIYANTPIKANFHEILANSGSTSNKVKMVHRVRPGDYLHKIAARYNCTIDDIMVWNPEMSSELAVGQTLTIWVDTATYQQLQTSNNN